MSATIQYVWAPWCMECKAMAPHVDSIAAEYTASVELSKTDVSESRELAAKLGVMATPTIIGRDGDTELFRVTGRRSPTELRHLFEAAAAGSQDVAVGRADRMLRVGTGSALAIIGGFLGPAWPLVGVGAGVVIWGMLEGARR